VCASRGDDDDVLLRDGATQVAEDLSGAGVENHQRLDGMDVGLENFAVFQPHPRYGKSARVRHEFAKVIVPAKIAELPEFVDLSSFGDVLDGRYRVARDDLQLIH